MSSPPRGRSCLSLPLPKLSTAVVALLLALAPPALAQEAGLPAGTDRSEAQGRLDELFQRTLEEPGNLDLAFAYAALATELGNYEAAVTALERMLFFNPDLPRVQLELGSLYYRMGSPAMAESYFDKATEAPDVPAEVKERVAEYKSELARQQNPNKLGGSLFVGFQHQSNANIAPSSAGVRAGGADVTLLPQFQKKADQNLFGNGTVQYSYDLGNQAGDTIEATASIFGNKHFRVRNFDLAILESTVGPRFNFGNGSDPLGIGDASLRPYLIANEVLLGGASYFATYGTGLEYLQTITKDLTARLGYEFRQKNYKDAAARPATRLFNGSDNIVSVATTYAVTDGSALGLAFDFTSESTRAAFNDFRDYAVTANYQISFADPFGWSPRPWLFNISGSRAWSFYGGADAFIDPGVTRRDHRWRYGFSQVFPITGTIAVILQAQRDVVASTIPNFSFSSNSVTIGPQIRF